MDDTIVDILTELLGEGHQLSSGEIIYYCPFCKHYKPKLQINVDLGQYNCWTCNVSGKKIETLFKKLKVYDRYSAILHKYKPHISESTKIVDTNIELPKEYIPLAKAQKTPEYRNAISYLITKRNLTAYDILRYSIGYCEEGKYKNRLIFPSYDSNCNLNYFSTRSYYESDTSGHLNPKYSKNIIGFENMINWNNPIILVEGALDAIATKRNCIPLFGKFINDKIKFKISEEHVREVYICLDLDAIKQALWIIEYFMKQGINVYVIELESKDPAATGYIDMQHLIKHPVLVTLDYLVRLKLKI